MTGPGTAGEETGVALRAKESRRCAVCDATMDETRHPWCFRCPRCGFLASTLPAHIGDGAAADAVDETLREGALAGLRKKNFERMLDLLGEHAGSAGGELLEVGCAHGWFLDSAARRGYIVHGIEPDAPMAQVAAGRGHDVNVGFFPQALDANRRYDVIVFNDVFEHLPDVRSAIAACRARLCPRGLLVINLPSSRGTLFRIASLMDRFGISGPYERLWQKGFPSPHLSYFHPAALARLVEPQGFAQVYSGRLDSIDIGGLWQRLRYDRKTGVVVSVLLWCGIALATPLLSAMPGDIALEIFRASE